MYIKNVFTEFLRIKSLFLKPNTISLYERMFKLHFKFFDNKEIEDLVSNDIDEWIGQLRKNKNNKRFSFEHELCLLQNIISFYNEYIDGNRHKIDVIKKRHRLLSTIVDKKNIEKNKELTEEEFIKFKEKIYTFYGEKYELMVILQYYQALRISEVVSLHYNDIHICRSNPALSTITINKSIAYNHGHGLQDRIQAGYKNGKLKILPLMPEVYKYLVNRIDKYKGKYLFLEDETKILSYTKIQKIYNRAFKESDLPYRSTHVLRHGGCRLVYNRSKGNVIIASQLLGNTEAQTLKVYAKGYKKELFEYVTNCYTTSLTFG